MQLTERDELIIYEVSRWKCVLGRHIKVLAEFTGQRAADRRIKKLIDNEYISRKRYIYGVSGILSITNKAKKEFDIKLPIGEIRIEQITHDIAVLDTAIYLMKTKNIERNDIISEKQIRNSLGFVQRQHLPDFVYNINDDKYCVEIELSQKSKTRLEKNIEQNYINYDYQAWIVPETKVKIIEILSDNSNKYSNIEIIKLEVINEFIKNCK